MVKRIAVMILAACAGGGLFIQALNTEFGSRHGRDRQSEYSADAKQGHHRMVARSVVDVVLAEAGGRTEQERFADMLAIVSAIANRASKTGVSWESITGAKDKRGNPQFDALGGKMPAGSEKYRALAERAIAHVKANGPTHGGVFYATPSKVGNLPGGLTKVAETERGHVYFSDPKNRSILTSNGYVVPVAATSAGLPALPSEIPLPPSRPVGLERLAPSYSIDYSMLDDPGKQRTQIPTSGIVDKVAEAANRVIPGVTTALYAGMEPPGRPPAGTPYRHPLGFAGDFDFFDGKKRVTDKVALHDIAMTMAAKHKANIGYDERSRHYMGPGRIHIDTMPLSKYPGAAQWAGTAAGEWAKNLNFARATGIGPTPYRNAPTPTPRDVGLAMPVSLQPDRPMSFPEPAKAPVDNPIAMTTPPITKAVATGSAKVGTGLGGAMNAHVALPPMPTPVPAAAKTAYQQLSATLGQSGAKNLSGVGVPTMAPPMPAPREISNKPVGYHFPSTPPAPARIAASTFPAAPRPPAEIPYAARPPSEKRTATAREVLGAFAKGALLGGIPGAIGRGLDKALTVNNPGPGQWGGLGNALSGLNPFAGPGIFTPLGGAERFGVGSADAAMFGPRGATYTASNGTTIGGLGNGYSNRTSGQYGWTETVDPSGSVVGIDYGNGGGGLAGLLSGLFDGGGKSGKGK